MCLAYYDTGQSGLICLLRVSHMVMRKPLYDIARLHDEHRVGQFCPTIKPYTLQCHVNFGVGAVDTETGGRPDFIRNGCLPIEHT